LEKSYIKLGILSLSFLLLAGCTNNSNNKSSLSSKARSEKLAKESSKKKAESKRKFSESKKKAESESKAKAESESKAKETSQQAQVESQQITSSNTQVDYSQSSNNVSQQQPKTQSQINQERGYDPKGNPVMPGQDHAPGTDVYGNPDPWLQGQIEWAKQNGYLNQDGTPTEKGRQAASEVEANADPNDTGDPDDMY